MDNSGLGGGFLSGPNGRLFDLESSIHREQQPQLGQPFMGPHNHMIMMTDLENEHRSVRLREAKGLNRKGFPVIALTDGSMSEEDEPSYKDDVNGENSSKGKNGSPWKRMKWTDNAVRLLIVVVSRVGDDGMIDGAEGHKRKSVVLQKKGKWKTVSKIMISKGSHVSPQQCEDKFNDLNKRYKKLNDILGRGTSCRVVENPSVMDSLPHLSSKAKDDVRKILSSKHLFYQEMCAYHNGQSIPNCQDLDLQGCMPPERCLKENHGSNDSEDDDGDDEMDDEDDNNAVCREERIHDLDERKKASAEEGHLRSQCAGHDRFKSEMAGIFQDPTRSSSVRKDWIKRQMLQLHEERVNLQSEAFELEKQRFKWLRYCNKKDRELERLRLENERMKLENKQSKLQLKQKEMELGYRMFDSSLEPTSLGIDRLQGKGQIDTCSH